MENNENEYDLLVLGEINYKEAHKGEDDSVLFPPEWDMSSNYSLKNEILEEAIMNNILISQTKKFQDLIEKNVDFKI
jgi:hypothetical protein